MTLHVLGSSSAGNCYVLEASDGCLVIEAGVELREVQKCLSWQISRVNGLVVSHSHGDHAKYIGDYAKRGIDVYALEETIDETRLVSPFVHAVRFNQRYAIGSFMVMPIEMFHDVACAGYVIFHKEMGKLFFITDTEYVRTIVRGCNHLLVECNYADDILEENILEGRVSAAMRKRLLHSHMEEKTTMGCIRAHKGIDLRTVVLLHLSSNNSDTQRFKEHAQKEAGVPVYIARGGRKIELMR